MWLWPQGSDCGLCFLSHLWVPWEVVILTPKRGHGLDAIKGQPVPIPAGTEAPASWVDCSAPGLCTHLTLYLCSCVQGRPLAPGGCLLPTPTSAPCRLCPHPAPCQPGPPVVDSSLPIPATPACCDICKGLGSQDLFPSGPTCALFPSLGGYEFWEHSTEPLEEPVLSQGPS